MTRGQPGLTVYLLLRGRSAVVIGGGKVAAGKVEKLLAVGADVTVVAPALGSALAAWSDAGRFSWLARSFEPADVATAWFVVAATGSPTVDASVFAACEAHRVWCNAADIPFACSAYWMAQRQAGDAVVAAGTGGAAPGLAGRIADEAMLGLPADLAGLVDHYAQARATVLAAALGDGAQVHVRNRALRRLARQPWATLRAEPAQLTEALLADIGDRLAPPDGPGDSGDPGASS